MSKNRHGGKKRQKQRRHFRRQVDIAYIWQQQQQRGEGGIAICHIALCSVHIFACIPRICVDCVLK